MPVGHGGSGQVAEFGILRAQRELAYRSRVAAKAKTKRAKPKPDPRWELKQLVGTYTLGPLRLEPESTTLRIELYKAIRPKGRYQARVWREEFFRVQPTFPQTAGVPKQAPADKLVTVEENLFMDIEGSSPAKALDAVLSRVAERFGPGADERL